MLVLSPFLSDWVTNGSQILKPYTTCSAKIKMKTTHSTNKLMNLIIVLILTASKCGIEDTCTCNYNMMHAQKLMFNSPVDSRVGYLNCSIFHMEDNHSIENSQLLCNHLCTKVVMQSYVNTYDYELHTVFCSLLILCTHLAHLTRHFLNGSKQALLSQLDGVSRASIE